ncbi:MAG: Pseudouridine kinase [Firmicutes bacterium ADurb.Bin182]|nr:MAG: Pseudouridine kinase [Firmicutes bacterium ADurb.Bin182]
MDFINCCDICVLDANISREAIEFLTKNASVPLFLDPVSAAKASKTKDLIGCFHTVKPNRIEAGILAGSDTSTDEGLFAAADSLLSKGVKKVFISLGEEGILYTDESNRGIAAPILGKVVNTTGAGDAAMAALAWGWIKGLSAKQCAKAACRASSLALECEGAVNGMMNEEAIYPRNRTQGDGFVVF